MTKFKSEAMEQKAHLYEQGGLKIIDQEQVN